MKYAIYLENEEVQMNRHDLKQYKYTQEWIKDRMEYLEGYKSVISNITQIISDMPKRN